MESLPPLSLGMRLALYALGGFLVLLGLAGLVLPGLQGILTLAAGTALLTLADHGIHRRIEGPLSRRWPKAWSRLETLRRRLHDRLRRLDPWRD